jgi:hypothetical protein
MSTHAFEFWTPHDQQRFAQLITDFVEGCGFERPFHPVVLDARGTASVRNSVRA